ncbi:hypothetical protein S40285_05160 [Stachybotrys chlorohalonatus IBT 40285]|uniref:Wings apart-like protein C-terminal domain-containing protein n=1 Tax=Stachybotrys chlorohalonatus (strain IBT 40285) TaxID=1283841 RepID=A0A084QF68_STAC4|nr:hypothetical protein S40285_05160 [Stachybotrys chlorohalonata IBT 40285]
MTASQRTEGAIPGQRRLITYGKASRPRHSSSIDADVSKRQHADKPIDPTSTRVAFQSPSTSMPIRSPATAQDSVPEQQRAQVKYGSSADSRIEGQQRKRKRTSRVPEAGSISEGSTALQRSHSSAKGGEPNTNNIATDEVPASEMVGATSQPHPTNSNMRNTRTAVGSQGFQLSSDGSDEQPTPRPKSRRIRLIDALAAQRPRSPATPSDNGAQSPTLQPRSESSTPFSQRSTVAKDVQPGDPSQANLQIQNDPTLHDQLLPQSPSLSDPGGFDFDDDAEDDGDLSQAIRSVHELRRAGAHNRFADEMEDLLSRIGKPGKHALPMRRTALLELAHKLQDDRFVGQFQAHAARDSIFKDVGEEQDVVCGIVMTAVLILFLSSGAAPHLLRQLAEDRLGGLLERLINVSEDIETLASQRQVNLPGSSRRSLSSLKRTILGMEIWHGFRPSILSPRYLALKLLDIFVRCSDPILADEVMRSLELRLTALGGQHIDGRSRDEVELVLVLAPLEAHSSTDLDSSNRAAMIVSRGPLVTGLLQASLDQWPAAQRHVEMSTLKLAINTTNTEGGARAFDDKSLLTSLTTCIEQGFTTVAEAMRRNRQQKAIYDSLLLLLGVMINILEHCPDARLSLDKSCLEIFIDLYVDNHMTMSEADSVEKSEFAVAFGYLAVLLGYLCLAGPSARQLEARIPGKGIEPLIKTIKDFIEKIRIQNELKVSNYEQVVVAIMQGKSSLAVQFVDGHFVDSYYPTIENTFSKTIRYKGQDFLTEIVDTAGQDEYSILNSKHFIGIHGYMLVYSVSSLPSFEMVQVIREKILNHLADLSRATQGTESVPIVIVGNKSDLRPEQRQVSAEDGKKLSEKFQCGWTEASARYNENVGRAFELLIGQIEKSQNPGEAPAKSNCIMM